MRFTMRDGQHTLGYGVVAGLNEEYNIENYDLERKKEKKEKKKAEKADM